MFVPGKPFQPSLMFLGKAKGAKLTNVSLCWKGLPEINTLAYCGASYDVMPQVIC